MTVLITGAGLIGTHTAKTLLDQGVGVCLLDPNPSLPYIESVVGPDRELFRVERGDVRDFPRLIDLVLRVGVTRILHTAGLVGPGADESPSLAFDVNVAGTLNLIEVARIRSLARIVLVSSSFVYAISDEYPISDETNQAPLRESESYRVPSSFYASYKAMAEIMALTYHRLAGVNAIIVRPCSVYGRGLYVGGAANGRMLNDVIAKAIDGSSGAEIALDVPTAERAYVKDIALGIREAIFVEKPSTRVYNLGSGEVVTTTMMADAINRAVPGARIVPAMTGPGDRRLLDSTLARQELAYEPKWPLDQAIADYATELRDAG